MVSSTTDEFPYPVLTPVFVCVGVFMCLNVYARAAQTDE